MYRNHSKKKKNFNLIEVTLEYILIIPLRYRSISFIKYL